MASLRSRMLVMLSMALLTVFAAILGLHAYQLSHERSRAEARVMETARGLAAEYRRLLEEPHGLLDQIATLGESGIVGDLCKLPLSELVRRQPQLLDLALLDDKGHVGCASNFAVSKESLAAEPVVRAALESRRPATAAASDNFGRAALIIARPLEARSPGTPRLAVALLDLEWINRHFAPLVTEASVLRILDRDGRFLVRQPDPACCLGRSGLHLAGIGEALASGMPQTLESLWLDQVIRLQADLPLPAEIGGVLSVGIQPDIVRAPAERSFAAGTLFLILLSAILFTLAWRETKHHVLQPLQGIADAAVRLREGDFAVRLSQTGTEEFRRLAAEFNGMAATIEEKQQRLRLAACFFEQANEAIVITDAQGDIVAVNPSFTRITGYAVDEAIGQNPRILKSDRHDADFYQAMWASLEENGFWSGEIWNRRKDGSVYPEWLSISAVRNLVGEVTHHVAVFTDLTLLKAVESALRTGEARLNTLIESIPDVIIFKDGEGRWLVVNEATRNLLQLDQVPWQGKGDLELTTLNPAFSGEHMANWANDEDAWLAGSLMHSTAVVHQAGGGVRLYDVTKVPRYDEYGKRQALIVIGRDVTIQRRNAAELESLNAELDLRVAARTRELETSNRELEAFSYSVSHDLRAPLRAINGFSHLLEQEFAASLDAKAKDYLGRVRAGSIKMGQLIDDLLSLSQISRQKIKHQHTDLSTLAKDISDELQVAEPCRRVEWSIAPGMVSVCDPGLIRVVLHNLLGNAWKYASKRDLGKIEFGAVEQDVGKRCYFVRDNGAGFDMRYADKLFNAFQRLHSPDEFSGTGIGLAIVARIIRRHGGRVWAEGKVDEGATFWFTL